MVNSSQNNVVVILAGGYGTRLGKLTETIPKPMLMIGDEPMIFHIMKSYSKYGFKKFVILMGYKKEVIIDYFTSYNIRNSSIKIKFEYEDVEVVGRSKKIDWEVSLIDTGLDAMTGGRILRAHKYIDSKIFHITYGDGLSNINPLEVEKSHYKSKKLLTISAIQPKSRYGEIRENDDGDPIFIEKPVFHDNWVNAGFMVADQRIFGYIKDDSTVFEKEIITRISEERLLGVHHHNDFWMCVDTARELEEANSYVKSGEPWR